MKPESMDEPFITVLTPRSRFWPASTYLESGWPYKRQRMTYGSVAECRGGLGIAVPWKRGDINTVLRHLNELKRVPGAGEVYRALVKSALIDLPGARKKEIMRLMR
jgi:hypothetical protein